MTLIQKEIKRVTIRKKEEQTTTIYGPSSEVYGNVNIYSDLAQSDGIYKFSAEVFAVSGYYGCIDIIINGATVETFRTSSTSYVSFTYQTTLTAGDIIVLYLYGEPNQNAGCRNVQIDTVDIDRTEKQIRPEIPGWRVNSNTIFYLKLRGNLTDDKGTYTWNGGTNVQWNTSVANIPVAHLTYNNGYLYTTTGPTLNGSDSYTISGRVKQDSATGAMCLLNCSLSGSTLSALYKFYDGNYKGYWTFYLTNGFEWQYNYNPGTNWHLWTVTYTPGTRTWYLDGTQVATASGTMSGSGNTVALEIGRLNRSNDRSPSAYYSDVLFERSAKTAQEIQDYYNATKAFYGIS